MLDVQIDHANGIAFYLLMIENFPIAFVPTAC